MKDLVNNLFDFMQSIEARLAKIQSDIAEVRIDLNYHIRRTDQNDEKIDLLAQNVRKVESDIVGPLQRDLFKFKVVFGLVTTLVVGACGLLGWLINLVIQLKDTGIL